MKRKAFTTMLVSCLAAGMISNEVAAESGNWCEEGKTVKFAGLNWESGMLLTGVMQAVLERGYGCRTDSLPGNSITMEQALANNDIQVFAEEWIGRSEAWNKAAAADKVVAIGEPIKGATEGWYVPRYLIEGDAQRGVSAKAPDLKRIADLPAYSALFRDPEEPAKGRFYNCPAGWTCERENTDKMIKHGLESHFVNYRPGTGPALDAAIASSYKRRQPILTYYWSPTALLGKYDLVKLEEAPGDEAHIKIQVGVSKAFHDNNPELMALFAKINIPIDLLNRNLAIMADERLKADKVAERFLKDNPEVWQQWVSPEAEQKIHASLQ